MPAKKNPARPRLTDENKDFYRIKYTDEAGKRHTSYSYSMTKTATKKHIKLYRGYRKVNQGYKNLRVVKFKGIKGYRPIGVKVK